LRNAFAKHQLALLTHVLIAKPQTSTGQARGHAFAKDYPVLLAHLFIAKPQTLLRKMR
jgi:hypothetical protein